MRADFLLAPIAQAYSETFSDAKTQQFGMLTLSLPVVIDMGMVAGNLRERPWTGGVFVHLNVLLR
jgi:hypothetical protein